MSKNQPYTRQEGFITIIREADLVVRYAIQRTPDNLNFQWADATGTPIPTGTSSNVVLNGGVYVTGTLPAPTVLWTDIYVTGIDFGKKAKSVSYNPAGASYERTEIIGLQPSLSFKSAFINKQLYRLMKFRTKFRSIIEYKADVLSLPYDTLEFRGSTLDNWTVSGDSMQEQAIVLKVEENPDLPEPSDDADSDNDYDY